MILFGLDFDNSLVLHRHFHYSLHLYFYNSLNLHFNYSLHFHRHFNFNYSLNLYKPFNLDWHLYLSSHFNHYLFWHLYNSLNDDFPRNLYDPFGNHFFFNFNWNTWILQGQAFLQISCPNGSCSAGLFWKFLAVRQFLTILFRSEPSFLL